ncbi:MAG: metallopeptidase TldD-related protein [Thermoplasmata archaeon]|nr:metallopeptidase TldD-related protein [Thermoplasmata archaeon]
MTDAGAKLERVASRVLSLLPDGVTGDVRIHDESWTTMRFANGQVHQPHVERSRSASLRAVRDHRIATATTTDTTPEGLARLVREAVALASIAPVDHRVGPFPAGGRVVAAKFSDATARMRPEEVGRMAARALDAAGATDLGRRVSGAVHVGTQTLAVANTSGRSVSETRTSSESSVLAEEPGRDPPVSGWAEEAHWDARQLDTARLGREALARMPSGTLRSAKPGTYRVLLSGAAAAELIGFLGHLGFSGHGEEEGWSCLKSRRGRRAFPRAVSLVDDGRSVEALPAGFDEEGTAKRRTSLIDEGVVGGPATDLVTAGHLGTKLTGHALPPESPFGEWGPVHTSLVFGAGDVPESELPSVVRDGLLITRFHYVRVVHPSRGVITGMTRDGTYRIRKGEVAEPVRNLRFTHSVVEALHDLEAWSRERRRYADEHGLSCVTAPALVIKKFQFTSATVF